MVDEALHLSTKSYGTETLRRSAAKPWQVALGLIDDPTLFDVPEGIAQVLIQGRMCGDYYAEISGPRICRASTASTPEQALRQALAA